MMDKPRWTPLAWEKRDLFVFADPHTDGRVIAKFDLHDVGHEQAHANAQLSAAAPDLAKAAEPFVHDLAGCEDLPDDLQVGAVTTGLTFGHLRALATAYLKALGNDD